MRFQFYVHYLEKLENSALLFLMTALLLWAFSLLCQIPTVRPAPPERGGLTLTAQMHNFFFFNAVYSYFPYNYQINICYCRKFRKHTHTQKKAREKNIAHALKPVNILIHVGPVFTVLHV